MADLEEAKAALRGFDDDGRKALSIACGMWEQKWREAEARAEKAEWLLEQFLAWARERRLCYSAAEAEAHWTAEHEWQPSVLVSWFEADLAVSRAEFNDMRARLACAQEGEGRAMTMALQQQARAEAAEAERDRWREEADGGTTDS